MVLKEWFHCILFCFSDKTNVHGSGTISGSAVTALAHASVCVCVRVRARVCLLQVKFPKAGDRSLRRVEHGYASLKFDCHTQYECDLI